MSTSKKMKISPPQLAAELTAADWADVLDDEDHELVGASVAGASYEYGNIENAFYPK